jgi:hypothetical protein
LSRAAAALHVNAASEYFEPFRRTISSLAGTQNDNEASAGSMHAVQLTGAKMGCMLQSIQGWSLRAWHQSGVTAHQHGSDECNGGDSDAKKVETVTTEQTIGDGSLSRTPTSSSSSSSKEWFAGAGAEVTTPDFVYALPQWYGLGSATPALKQGISSRKKPTVKPPREEKGSRSGSGSISAGGSGETASLLSRSRAALSNSWQQFLATRSSGGGGEGSIALKSKLNTMTVWGKGCVPSLHYHDIDKSPAAARGYIPASPALARRTASELHSWKNDVYLRSVVPGGVTLGLFTDAALFGFNNNDNNSGKSNGGSVQGDGDGDGLVVVQQQSSSNAAANGNHKSPAAVTGAGGKFAASADGIKLCSKTLSYLCSVGLSLQAQGFRLDVGLPVVASSDCSARQYPRFYFGLDNGAN